MATSRTAPRPSLLPPLHRRVMHVVRRQLLRGWPGERERPSYFIIGGKRCGTTSLDEYLVAHPLVLRGLVEKGCRYYDVNFQRGPQWYARHLPPRRAVDRLEARRGTRPLLGESSPYYVFHPEAIGRIAADCPQARLFLLLRDPVQRAWSHYRYEVARGFEELDFLSALQQESARLAVDDPMQRAFAHRHFSYLGRSRYADQLARVHRHFDPGQVLVLESERLFADPADVMRRAFAHLGLPPHEQTRYPAHKGLGDGPPIPAEAEEWLLERLADDRVRLGALLDFVPVWA
ncbi:sulfotransferase [Nocardioides sp.]|uniref:sulfotransferase family protein n=1 Tax=Nocardioides sp. TaxID=35761 RepID=UPI00356AF7E3